MPNGRKNLVAHAFALGIGLVAQFLLGIFSGLDQVGIDLNESLELAAGIGDLRLGALGRLNALVEARPCRFGNARADGGDVVIALVAGKSHEVTEVNVGFKSKLDNIRVKLAVDLSACDIGQGRIALRAECNTHCFLPFLFGCFSIGPFPTRVFRL